MGDHLLHLNALLFALIGLQLPVILDALSGYSPAHARSARGVIVSATVILARFLWVIRDRVHPALGQPPDP